MQQQSSAPSNEEIPTYVSEIEPYDRFMANAAIRKTEWTVSRAAEQWTYGDDRNPCLYEDGDEDHDFSRMSEWDGDPSIPNGVRTWSCLRCNVCGKETEDDGEYYGDAY